MCGYLFISSLCEIAFLVIKHEELQLFFTCCDSVEDNKGKT